MFILLIAKNCCVTVSYDYYIASEYPIKVANKLANFNINRKNYNFLNCDWFKKTPNSH